MLLTTMAFPTAPRRARGPRLRSARSVLCSPRMSGRKRSDRDPERARTSRTPASTRLLHACRCAAGRWCRATAAPRPSRPRSRHTIGLHRPSGFPRSARSDGMRCAEHGVESRKDVAAASGLRSRRREGLSRPIPNIPPAAAHPEPTWRGPVYGRLALESACASSRVIPN